MADTLRPSAQIAGYELVRQLGEGGMGEVWLATDRTAQRAVALKFVKPHLLSDPTFHKRFLDEAKTLGRLEHERIVPLYTVIDAGGHLALVLRFIEGESLAARIDRERALPLDFVIAGARDILDALDFAHKQGTIHRDLKPLNILIDRQNRSFLTDFGIAITEVVERHTQMGFSVGSPHYMSPEQIRTPQAVTAGPAGRLSDIYSIGVVLYEMLTGTVPFGADLPASETYRVQHAHCEEPPPPLRQKNPGVPEAVERVVMACLAKSPSERPQSCAEVLRRLETATVGVSQAAARHKGNWKPTEVLAPPRPESAARAPAASPAAGRGSRGRKRAASLVAALVLIAALVSFTIWSSGGETPGTAPQPAEDKTEAGAAAPPADQGRQSGRGTVSAGSGAVPGGGARASNPQQGERTIPPGRGREQTPGPVPPATRPDASAAAEEDAYIRQLVDQARKLTTGDQPKWCDASTTMGRAAAAAAKAQPPRSLSARDLEFRDLASEMCRAQSGGGG